MYKCEIENITSNILRSDLSRALRNTFQSLSSSILASLNEGYPCNLTTYLVNLLIKIPSSPIKRTQDADEDLVMAFILGIFIDLLRSLFGLGSLLSYICVFKLQYYTVTYANSKENQRPLSYRTLIENRIHLLTF